MEKRFDVIALGELLIDFTHNGESEQGNGLFEANPGGAPCNVLSMLTSWGHKTGFIGKVGNDMFGKLLAQTIAEVGIDTKGLVFDEAVNTTLAFVQTFANGDRDFSFYRKPGADMCLLENEIDAELLSSCKIFHYGSLSMTAENCFMATKKAIAVAKDNGAILSFDPNLRPPLWESLEVAKEKIAYGMEQCQILKISDNEITWFTGLNDYDQGAQFILSKYPNIKLLLVSMGPDGSRAFCNGMRVEAKAFHLPDTIETTGAGDTFCGCILHYVLEHPGFQYNKEQLEEMLYVANGAAALVTTKKGALRVMPSPADIEKLLGGHWGRCLLSPYVSLVSEESNKIGDKRDTQGDKKHRPQCPQQFLQEQVKVLLEFGKACISPGGGAYYLGDDGTPWTDRARETWITSRMVHVYSIGTLLGYRECKEIAEGGIKGLLGELRDTEYGGWYAGIDADGNFLPNKQCYAHAFVILAATSGVLAGVKGAEELLQNALTTFDQYFWLEAEGLTCDTWDREFKVLDSYRGINANMHTVEAFLAVADVTGKTEYRERAGRIIQHVVRWAKENQYRIPEHFTDDWRVELDKYIEKPDDPFKPYGATPGHGIEWARLITQWALSTYSKDNQERQTYIEIACELFDRAIADAWNCDGAKGIVYTTDWNGQPVVRDRMHWTLAEAINTSAVLYRVTQNEKYKALYSEFMEYLDQTVIDHEKGSWFHQLDEHNQLKTTVWPGKADLYHALQAMLIPYSRCDVSIAKAILDKEDGMFMKEMQEVFDQEINPITKLDYPDPDVIRVGDVYYMVSTTMHFFPGCEILRSYNLVNWEHVCYVYDLLDSTKEQRLEEGEIYGKGMWAACLRYHKGIFYVCFVANDTGKTYLYRASQITGPWEKSNIQGFYHDCSLLFDEDDRVYIAYGNKNIYITELDEKLCGPKPGGLHRLVVSDEGNDYLGYEGTHFYKINGTYYLFFIHSLRDQWKRVEACFYADHLEDDFQGGDVLNDDRGYCNQGVAQGGIVDTPEGSWYAMLFQDHGAVGRIPILLPVHWEGRVPVFGIDGKVPAKMQIGDSFKGYQYGPLVGSDDFKNQEKEILGEKAFDCFGLRSFWQFNHEPDLSGFDCDEKEGALVFTTTRLAHSLVDAKNVLTQRMLFPFSSGEITVDFSQMKEGDYAGIAAFQGCFGMVAVHKAVDGYYLVMQERIERQEDALRLQQGELYTVERERIKLEGASIRLRVEADFYRQKDETKFFYEKDGQWVIIGTTHKVVFKLDHFTGCRFGLFYYATEKLGGQVRMKDFRRDIGDGDFCPHMCP